MDKYINSTKVLNFIQDCLNHEDKISDIEKATLIAIQQYIERIQIEDVTPIIHAHWERTEMGWPLCSHCNRSTVNWDTYCPHCGANMKGEIKNEK